MASLHKVQAGDCLTSIAVQYGFTEWQPIWDHARNAQLKRQRPDPNILHPGDIVFIPDKEQKQETRGTAQRHVFQIGIVTKIVRIALENDEGRRITSTRYALKIGDRTYTGTTDGQGMLRQEVPADAQEGELLIEGHSWPIEIGHLNPVEHVPDLGVSGIKARLRNLHYYLGEIDDQMDDPTRAAIQAFQRDNQLPDDGKCQSGSDTLKTLIKKHGS